MLIFHGVGWLGNLRVFGMLDDIYVGWQNILNKDNWEKLLRTPEVHSSTRIKAIIFPEGI